MEVQRLDVTPTPEDGDVTHAIAYAPADEGLVLLDVRRTLRVRPWGDGGIRRRSDFYCDLPAVTWHTHDIGPDPDLPPVFQCRVRTIGLSDLRPLGRHDVFPRKRTGAKGLTALRYYVCCETPGQALRDVVEEPACELWPERDPAIVSGQMMRLALVEPDVFLALGSDNENVCCVAFDGGVAVAYPSYLVRGDLMDGWVSSRVSFADGTSLVRHDRADEPLTDNEIRLRVAYDLGEDVSVEVIHPDPRDQLCAAFLLDDDGNVEQAVRTRTRNDPDDLITKTLGRTLGHEPPVRPISPKECVNTLFGHDHHTERLAKTPL